MQRSMKVLVPTFAASVVPSACGSSSSSRTKSSRVLARSTGFVLPADLQQAGRGEIAPSPGGS